MIICHFFGSKKAAEKTALNDKIDNLLSFRA